MNNLIMVCSNINNNFLKTKGFTLLEIIVSIGLSAFVLAITYSAYFGINKSIESATEEQEVLASGRMMIELFKIDLGGVVSSAKYPFKGTVNELGEGETTTFIEFITISSMSEQQPQLNKVGYTLISNEKDERTMVRFSSRDIKADLLKNGTFFEVSQSISSFNVEFFNGQEWTKKWDSGSDGKVPQQVRLTIEAKDIKGNTKTVTTEEGVLGGKKQ